MSVNKVYLLLLLLFASKGFGSVDPAIDWKTINTPHFEIIYDAKQIKLAEHYAAQAERAYNLLVPIFKRPPEKTLIIISDDTDFTNGFASPLPQPTIVVFPALPSMLSSLNNYGDWAQELVLHEYVHILNFEPSLGIWNPFRFIFGSIVRPNGLLPRWYLEGLAVELESRLTQHGRLKSNYYGSLLRSMVLSDSLEKEDIARINETVIPSWPRGQRPYFLGALLWHKIVEEHGTEVIGKLNDDYASRLPYFLNGPIENYSKKSYQNHLTELYHQVQNESREQIKLIESKGHTAGQAFPLPKDSYYSHSPIESPDGNKIAYITAGQHNDGMIAVLNHGGNFENLEKIKPLVIASKKGIGSFAWSPDSHSIVFEATNTFNRYYEFSDLYLYDFVKKSTRTLTKGVRAKNPSFSHDGTSVFFVKHAGGQNKLASLNLKTNQIKIEYTPPMQYRITNPLVLPNGNVLFSERNLKGEEKLFYLDLKKKKKIHVLKEFSPAGQPVFSGKSIVFTSGRTGVSNLYITSKKLKKAFPITNSRTSILNGSVSKNRKKILYSEMTSDGPKIYISDYPKKPESPPNLIEQKGSTQWPEVVEGIPDFEMKHGDYNSLSYLFPTYWLPFISAYNGGFIFQASVANSDPLNKHSYLILGGYDTLTEKPSYIAQYTNSTTAANISLSGANSNTYIFGVNETSKSTSGSISVSGPLFGSTDWYYGLSASSQSIRFPGRSLFYKIGPGVSLSYSDVSSKKGYQISPESGKSIALGYSYYIPKFSSVGFSQVSVGGSYYFSKWLPDRHVLSLKTEGVYTPENRSIFVSTISAGGEILAALIPSSFIVRGYPIGEFIGWSLLTTNLEYRFPLFYIFKGMGLFPTFFRKMHAALTVDSISLDGGYFDRVIGLNRTSFGTFFMSTGLELRLDTTIGYHIPFQIRLGAYYGFSEKAYGKEIVPFFGFGL